MEEIKKVGNKKKPEEELVYKVHRSKDADVRKCLHCLKMFDSYGKQNRLCSNCVRLGEGTIPSGKLAGS